MRYQRVKNVAWRRIGEETVIVHLARRRMLAVNEAGGAVWESLAGGEAVAFGEAGPFLADLEAEGVVERLSAEGEGPAVAVPGAATCCGASFTTSAGGFVPDRTRSATELRLVAPPGSVDCAKVVIGPASDALAQRCGVIAGF
jgi:hypothetical protein